MFLNMYVYIIKEIIKLSTAIILIIILQFIRTVHCINNYPVNQQQIPFYNFNELPSK